MLNGIFWMPITIPSPCINDNQQKVPFFVLFFFCQFICQSILEFDSVSTLSAKTIISENKKRNFSTQHFDLEVKPGDTNVCNTFTFISKLYGGCNSSFNYVPMSDTG